VSGVRSPAIGRPEAAERTAPTPADAILHVHCGSRRVGQAWIARVFIWIDGIGLGGANTEGYERRTHPLQRNVRIPNDSSRQAASEPLDRDERRLTGIASGGPGRAGCPLWPGRQQPSLLAGARKSTVFPFNDAPAEGRILPQHSTRAAWRRDIPGLRSGYASPAVRKKPNSQSETATKSYAHCPVIPTE